MIDNHFTLPEFGNFADNTNVFSMAVYAIEHGEKAKGMMLLCALRQHIVQRQEAKSLQWLLPEIASVMESPQYE